MKNTHTLDDTLGTVFSAWVSKNNISDDQFNCPILPTAWLPASKTDHTRDLSLKIWFHGSLSVFVVSICAVFGALLIPYTKKYKVFFNLLMLYLIALAVSALSGAAILVLIPEGLGMIDCNLAGPNLIVCTGILSCFIVNQMIKYLAGINQIGYDAHGTGHLPSDVDTPEKSIEENIQRISSTCTHMDNSQHVGTGDGYPLYKIIPDCHKDSTTVPHLSTYENESCLAEAVPAPSTLPNCPCGSNFCKGYCEAKCSCGKYKNCKKYNISQIKSTCREYKKLLHKLKYLKPVGWLCLIGDAVHNFLDGIAIGSTFSIFGVNKGWQVSIAILAEEFPHELGDFAVLMKAGLSIKQAIICNLLSAASCCIGFFLGMFFGEHLHLIVFAWMGGVFLFISLSSMLPELDEHIVALRNDKSVVQVFGPLGEIGIVTVAILGLTTGYAIVYGCGFVDFESLAFFKEAAST